MQSTLFSGKRRCLPSAGRANERNTSPAPRAHFKTFATIALTAAMFALLPACSSGDGGNNGNDGPGGEKGLAFTYPYNGQQDVVLDTQISVNFAGELDSGNESGLTLIANPDADSPQTTEIEIVADDNQPGIFRIQPAERLLPETTYSVRATQDISSGFTSVAEGEDLFTFTTRPQSGRPTEGPFEVVFSTATDTNPETDTQLVFTEFNALRLRFSEPVDSSTIQNGDGFTFTDSDGNGVPGRLTALGRYLTFDPTEDLDSEQTYTVTLTEDVISAFGKTLEGGYSDTITPVDTGETATQNLTVEPSAASLDALPDNPLNGLTTNNVVIQSQLIGMNNQLASNADSRDGLLTTLAEPGLEAFGATIPAVIRGGQKFQTTGLDLQLNGEIDTPVMSGPIDVNLINDVDVYLMANQLRNVETPTAVRLRFDLGIGTQINAASGTPENFIESLANGVFNQTVMNIQAAGTAVASENGDLVINTIGSFPIKVNRTGDAAVDFALQLTLPAGDQTPVQDDVTAPFVTAQSPSACLYVFGSPAYRTVYNQNDASPTALPEQLCVQTLAAGGATPPFINSFPVESSPAIVFSEPLAPTSVNSESIQLIGPSGNVPVALRVEGSSVVIDPADRLEPSTDYTIMLGSSDMLTDLAGNPVEFSNATGLTPDQDIPFTTETIVDNVPTAPLLGTLTPGIPCILTADSDDFRSGGGTAGVCSGDEDADSAPFPVFENPADVAVDAFLSKFVRTETIVLADGCLTSGPGSTNEVAGATVAVQEMDGSGQCVGAVEGELVASNRGDEFTREFSFRPAENFEPGTRYWTVICGDGMEATGCTSQIMDADGLALNTDPFNGTGSTTTSGPAAGGPDLIVPFDAIAVTEDYYDNTFTLPQTDTNGNGQFDEGEVPQAGNRALVNLSSAGIAINNPDRDDGAFPSFLSLARPIAIGQTLDDCSPVDAVVDDDGNSAVGATPEQCIEVALLAGGINSLTSINLGTDALGGVIDGALEGVTDLTAPIADIPAVGGLLNGLVGLILPTIGDLVNDTTGALQATLDGLTAGTPLEGTESPVQTGRILLRFPNEEAPDTGTQSGYIVEKCEGTFANGQTYDFEPCFAASLQLIANAPDGQLATVDQQTFTANIVGPVTFQQNGRLAISLRNTNTISLEADISLAEDLDILPAMATIDPAALNFQLVGSAVHGGRAFPVR